MPRTSPRPPARSLTPFCSSGARPNPSPRAACRAGRAAGGSRRAGGGAASGAPARRRNGRASSAYRAPGAATHSRTRRATPPPARRARRPRRPPTSGSTAARLGHDHGARCPVPRLDAALEVAVEAPGGHVAEVERRGARPADVAHARQHAPHHLGLAARAPSGLVAEARRRSRARSSASESRTRIGLPFTSAPPPREARNVSPASGSCTTPTSPPSASSSATDTHQAR